MKCRNHEHRDAEYVFVGDKQITYCCYQCFQNERDFCLYHNYGLPNFRYLSVHARVKDWQAFVGRVLRAWRQLRYA